MSKYVGGSLKWIKENTYDWIKNALWPTTVPIGPVGINPQNGEISAGVSAGIEVGGKEVLGVSAECGVSVAPGDIEPHKPIFNFRTKVGAEIPRLSKLPLIGEYLSNSHETNTPFGQIDNYEGKSSQTEAANRVIDTNTGELR
ncbi:MAG: hypothetical protein C3F06_04190 [Candidatus Methanoperedenaceae archaeon]|nr:MAG: hypothetical protein C3F06_04190 [Candidatus Methanoperedenaceae archaeon]